jgi:hypothetical protein
MTTTTTEVSFWNDPFDVEQTDARSTGWPGFSVDLETIIGWLF